MTRITSSSRAALAEKALEAFVQDAYCGRSISVLHLDDLRDAIADLVADLGRYADRRFRNRTPYTELICRGVGMWSAERSFPRSEPENNHSVHIAIDDGGAP